MENTRLSLLRNEEKPLNKFIAYTAYCLYTFIIIKLGTYLRDDHIKTFSLRINTHGTGGIDDLFTGLGNTLIFNQKREYFKFCRS